MSCSLNVLTSESFSAAQLLTILLTHSVLKYQSGEFGLGQIGKLAQHYLLIKACLISIKKKYFEIINDSQKVAKIVQKIPVYPSSSCN